MSPFISIKVANDQFSKTSVSKNLIAYPWSLTAPGFHGFHEGRSIQNAYIPLGAGNKWEAPRKEIVLFVCFLIKKKKFARKALKSHKLLESEKVKEGKILVKTPDWLSPGIEVL